MRRKEWGRTLCTNFENGNDIRIFLLPLSMRAMYAYVCKPRDKEKIRFSTLLEYRSVSVYLVIQELSTWIHTTFVVFYFFEELTNCELEILSVVNQEQLLLPLQVYYV